MTKRRKLSPSEEEAQLTARVLDLKTRGYTLAEIARMVGKSASTVGRVIERLKRRTVAEDAKQWRQVQLLRLERLLEACQSILDAQHVVVSNGTVVTEKVFDGDGEPVWVNVYGPTGEVLNGADGKPLVEQMRKPLEDHGAVLDAVAEMRKIEAEIAKLLGTQTPVKQAVEVQHVDYTVNGVDLDKVLGRSPDTK